MTTRFVLQADIDLTFLFDQAGKDSKKARAPCHHVSHRSPRRPRVALGTIVAYPLERTPAWSHVGSLLFAVLSAEVVVAVTLLFKTPLRKLVVLGLDRLKRGRGPVMVKTVAGTVLLVLASSLYSIAKISSGSAELGALTPTDQVLMSRHLLEASLMGIHSIVSPLLVSSGSVFFCG
ncbi:hypothetical protein B296_00039057 [Ensete ventricosum]|uniref:Endoplasmic reticulum transmembrane protein n=1 Tax=Ensete ventricosum TaxID=4639 RepID=A0A426ZUL5_ENSVE|nr:hypothetical protein B296_00039057 [Ensete ventricosum]